MVHMKPQQVAGLCILDVLASYVVLTSMVDNKQQSILGSVPHYNRASLQ
jgi:hypothetical protein